MSAPNHAGATYTTDGEVIKPTPAKVTEDTGTGLDYRTRPDRLPGYLTPADRFFIRSHAPHSSPGYGDLTLRVEGNWVRKPIAYPYDDLWNRFPLVSSSRTIECAGSTECSSVRNSGARSRALNGVAARSAPLSGPVGVRRTCTGSGTSR
ncbi:hypothetical protein GCM10009609_54570 [Pseudonocardia aurantiaca]